MRVDEYQVTTVDVSTVGLISQRKSNDFYLSWHLRTELYRLRPRGKCQRQLEWVIVRIHLLL